VKTSVPKNLFTWTRSVRVLTIMAATLVLATGITSSAAEATTSPAIWVGSPVTGTWGTAGDPSTTPGCCPAHHMLNKADPANDWSVDLSSIAGGNDRVTFNAHAWESSLDSHVTAVVTQIIDDNTCSVGGGGDMVTVGIYFDGALQGRATYAHLARNPTLAVGTPVNPAGSWLGDVDRSLVVDENCWTGPHVHFEMRAENEYSCWDQSLHAGDSAPLARLLGFVSGPTTPGESQGCS
jgi:hypothetical protein